MMPHQDHIETSQPALTLVSHQLCPYVQRAAIALSEKAVPHERVYVDLANKPDWFLALSPLGKTPVLRVGDRAIFESAVIVEYLEDTQSNPLHPADPLERAEHRAWIEFCSSVLNDIAGFYSAPDASALDRKAGVLASKFRQLEERISDGPYFDGERFSLVDAAFAPVFRYFDVFDHVADFSMTTGNRKLAAWRRALAERQSVRGAVSADYNSRLTAFLEARGSYLSGLIRNRGAAELKNSD